MHRSPLQDELNVQDRWPVVVICSVLALACAPLVWVFVDRILDPQQAAEIESSAVQLAIAVGFEILWFAGITARHRVLVDKSALTVTWTKSVFGFQYAKETWQRQEIEAIAVDERTGSTGRKSHSVYLIGPRGRRLMREDARAYRPGESWARAFDVPFRVPAAVEPASAAVNQQFNVRDLPLAAAIGLCFCIVPIMWVRILDPSRAPNAVVPLALLAIAAGMMAFGLVNVILSHRVLVDSVAQSVTWTRSVFGLRYARETWRRQEIEAIAIEEQPGTYEGKSYSVYLVGPRGRRLMRRAVDADDRWSEPWAKALGVPCSVRAARSGEPASAAANQPDTYWRSLTIWQMLRASLLTIIVLALAFWIQLGESAIVLGIGLAVFLNMIVWAVWYSFRYPPTSPVPKFTPSRFDFLGVVWLLSIPFGPFFGYFATEQLTAGNWQAMAGIRVFLCVLLPVIGVLPLLRCVRGTYALPAAAILAIGTAFPVINGLEATFDVLYGPFWQDVEVKAVRSLDIRLVTGTRTHIDDAFVDLSDGRTLRPVSTVDVHQGPARLLVLRGLDRILEAQQ